MATSKGQPETKLKNAWVPCRGHLPELCIIESRVHTLELRVIEGVVSVRAELHVDSISW